MKTLIAVLFLGLASATAQGHILFEPSAGYAMGTLTSTTTADVQKKSDLSSGTAGLRLAYVMPIRFWLGIEGETTFSGKSKAQEGTAEALDYTGTTGYVSIGYETMRRVRLYAAYGVYDSLVLKDSSGGTTSETTFSGGGAIKAGLGYHLTQHIAINFEYSMHDYKKFKNNVLKDVDLEQGGLKSQKTGVFGVNFSLPFFL